MPNWKSHVLVKLSTSVARSILLDLWTFQLAIQYCDFGLAVIWIEHEGVIHLSLILTFGIFKSQHGAQLSEGST